ncbi:MAG: 4Fe-4S binding protein [Hydrococcus sp. Prado102]|jgi:polyferredoxin|nr:4Fe-4S binding protein [Hydrococcus sp. Prado102]
MFAKIPERYMHVIRWGLTLGWLVLIASLFYDPISAQLTEPNKLFGSSDTCFEFQGECRQLTPYPLGARIFWGMVVPLSIITLLVFGHEAWRRICPLSFISQIPRALGWQRKHLVKENSWLHRNHSYLQMGLLFLGLNIRLLFVNSDRVLLGIFLLFTILSAITVGFLYGGKTWCNYFCPMAPVQKIYSEPSGLLSSIAHTAPPMSITQSMCRTVDKNGQEKSACVACKSPCMDIDAQNSYWNNIQQSDRKLLYYGYLGLVIGFYLYFWLYSGNWRFLSGGVWNETNQLATLLSPGFYNNGRTIPIPKLFAVPLTLTFFSSATYAIGLWIEKTSKRYNKRFKHPLPVVQVYHRLFVVFTFAAFNLLFFLGVRPTLGWLPPIVQQLLSWGAILASSLWLFKNWQRSAEQYAKERDGQLLRRQLNKLAVDFSQFLEGRSLEDLNPDELHALAKVLPGFTHQYRLQVYAGVLKEALEQRSTSPARSLKMFQSLRQELGINEQEHWQVLDKLCLENPNVFASHLQRVSEEEATVRRSFSQGMVETELTRQRPLAEMTISKLSKAIGLTKFGKSEADSTIKKPRDRKDK